jgi:hypothetical protein
MTRDEAEALATVLAAAFPNPPPPKATLALYAGELELLDSAAIARAAIAELYRDPEIRFLPTIGQIHDRYWEVRYRAEERERIPATTGARPQLPPGERGGLEPIRAVLEGSEIGRWYLARREPDAA